MTDEDLKVFIEDVISDMVGSGELEAGEMEGEEVEVEDEFEFEDEVEITEIGDEYKTGDALNPVEKKTFQEDERTDAEQERYKDGFDDAKDDVGTQLSQVQNYIASGVDAIIVNAVNFWVYEKAKKYL